MASGPEERGKWRRLLSPTSRWTRGGRARRRFNCGKQGEWDERAEAAIVLLQAHQDAWGAGRNPLVIADFGAGNERLRPLLASTFGDANEYHPYDLHPQLPTTEALDVAREMPQRQFDLVICLGLLEYLPSIPALARSLREVCRFALVSYVTSDSPVAISRSEREKHGWKTDLTAADLESAFGAAGFSALGTSQSDGRATGLWLWRKDR